jgi:hypothetical protein
MLQQFVHLMSFAMSSSLPDIQTIHGHDESTADYALHCNLCVFDEPLTRAEAMRQPDAHLWQEAMNEEVSWCYNKTWIEVNVEPWMNVLTSKWVFKRKRGNDGDITRYRARLCVRGFGQIPGLDYGAIFAPVVRYTTIRILLALCAHYGLYKTHLDAPKAFTQADLDTPLYMRAPTGVNLAPGKVFKLLRSLYGLKQGAMRWWTILSAFLLSIGFTQCVADPCLFYLVITPLSFAIVSVYVDDLLLCTTSEDLKATIVKKLYDRFQITDEGDFTWSLGMHITTSSDRHTITIDMERYTTNIIARFNFDGYTSMPIPMDPTARFSLADCPTTEKAKAAMFQYPFREALGSLMFLMVVFRMDIAFPTISLSRFASNPSENMWKAMRQIFRYLKGTVDIVLTYSRMMDTLNPLMLAYTDADWCSNDFDFRRAVIGYIVFLSGAAVSWMTKFNRPGLSTAEVEYHGMGAVSTEVVSHTHLLNELVPIQWVSNSEHSQSADVDPISIHCDNASARQVALHPHMHKRMKHLEIRYHIIRKFVQCLIIRFQLVSGVDNCSDMMVKANAKASLRKHRTVAFGPFTAPDLVYTPEELLRQSTNMKS